MWDKLKNARDSQETKHIETIWEHNTPEKNLQILKERLEETKKWFDYKVTSDKKYKLVYNWMELNIDIKSWKDLLNTAIIVKHIFDVINHKWYKWKDLKFKQESSPDWFSSDLKADPWFFRKDMQIMDWALISEIMWSDMNTSNPHFSNNVKWKMEYNTEKLADFLNQIMKDFNK